MTDSDHGPISETDLHAYVDGELTAERRREIEAWLAHRPEEAARVESYRADKRELRALFEPVLDEALPPRVLRAARAPRSLLAPQRLAAGIALALLSGAAGWTLHGELQAPRSLPQASLGIDAASGFAQRAAVAHAVFSPDSRRAVEVDAAHEDQLVAWLSRRMGAPMKPPRLQPLGYALEGGRLLPGGRGPVAQFMYRDSAGTRLTLYVSSEIGAASGANGDTAFRFGREAGVNVFYWVDGPFGYAISAEAERAELERVSREVYRQLLAAR